MAIDVKILAEANLVTQLLLGGLLVTGAYLARRRKKLQAHCLLMRIGIVVQVLAVAFVMGPATRGYLQHEPRDGFFNVELVLHAALGLTVVALWVYFNLAVEGVVKTRRRLAPIMRVAFTCWAAALLIGLHLYWQVWS